MGVAIFKFLIVVLFTTGPPHTSDENAEFGAASSCAGSLCKAKAESGFSESIGPLSSSGKRFG